MDGLDFDLRGFIDNSLLEWENRVSAVVVAGGCNFRCPYCHSWRYVTGLDGLAKLDPNMVFSLLERQRGWIDGVVFTGGEPTLQPGLRAMIERVREYDVQVKLHTNGSRPGVIGELLAAGLIDCLALDYKSPLDERVYRAAGIDPATGVLEAVRESFALAAASGVEREYHTTLNPRQVDLPRLLEMAKALEPGGLWLLQQYEAGDCLNPADAGQDRYDTTMLDAFETAAKREYGTVLLKRGKSQ